MYLACILVYFRQMKSRVRIDLMVLSFSILSASGCQDPIVPVKEQDDEQESTGGAGAQDTGPESTGSEGKEEGGEQPEQGLADPVLEGPFSLEPEPSPDFSFPEVRSKQTRIGVPGLSVEELRQVRNGNVDFSLDLLRNLDPGEPSNLVLSAVSLRSAFGMMHLMAQGETRGQIQSAMKFPERPELTHAGINYLDQVLKSRNIVGKDGRARLSFKQSTRLFLNHRHKPSTVFLDNLAKHFGTGLSQVNFGEDAESARVQINEWVSEGTNELIPELFAPGKISAETDWTFANAVYFDAPWDFLVESVGEKPFFGLDGKEHSVLTNVGYPATLHGQGKDLRWASLPLIRGKFSLFVILPDPGKFESVRQDLSAKSIETLRNNAKKGELDLQFPSFKLAPNLRLSDALSSMGLAELFAGNVDFGAVIDQGPKLLGFPEVVHKVFFEVNEGGVEAAGASGGESPPSGPDVDPNAFKIHLDRPFLFAVLDEPTGVFLFTGQFVKPKG